MDPKCPDCGSEFEIEKNVTVSEPYWPKNFVHYVNGGPARELPRRKRIAKAVAFCTGCEFVHEIQL